MCSAIKKSNIYFHGVDFRVNYRIASGLTPKTIDLKTFDADLRPFRDW